MAGDGYIDPNWPNPHGPHDARIIIYGLVAEATAMFPRLVDSIH